MYFNLNVKSTPNQYSYSTFVIYLVILPQVVLLYVFIHSKLSSIKYIIFLASQYLLISHCQHDLDYCLLAQYLPYSARVFTQVVYRVFKQVVHHVFKQVVYRVFTQIVHHVFKQVVHRVFTLVVHCVLTQPVHVT